MLVIYPRNIHAKPYSCFWKLPHAALITYKCQGRNEIAFHTVSSNLGKFLLKSLEERALLNPLRIDMSAPGCFACSSLCLPLPFWVQGRWVTGFGAVYLLHYSASLWCWLWTDSGWGLLVLNSFLSCGEDFVKVWRLCSVNYTCSQTPFFTFLMTYLLEGIIKN